MARPIDHAPRLRGGGGAGPQHNLTRLLFDIETDGLLGQLSTIHCIAYQNYETGEYYLATDSRNIPPVDATIRTIAEGLADLEQAEELIGHNIISFDIPAIQKVHPQFAPKATCYDTLVASLLMYPDMKEKDFARRDHLKRTKGEAEMNRLWPGSIIGRHGLDAWGFRLGEWKGDYSKARAEKLKEQFHARHMAARATGLKAAECPPKTPTRDEIAAYVWNTVNREMLDYAVQDVVVTRKLYDLLTSKGYSEEAVKLEHDFKRIICMMEREGYSFDVTGAEKLERTLTVRLAEIQAELQTSFPPWETKTAFIPRANNASRGYVKGQVTHKVKLNTFNPASRDHIADRLADKYGWKPTEFTETGKPKVDEDVLSKLTYPEAGLLTEGMMIAKRLGQIAEGNQAWLKLVTSEGKIHHQVTTNGAVTGRCTHSRPNVAQTPNAGAPFGPECRRLWGPPKGMKQVGADLSGLELRCLAHFMAVYDGGAYAKELLEGDIHTANQNAAGLPTRDNAKTFIYGFLYGAGPEKIGQIVGKGADAGKKLIASFLEKTPAIKKLRETLTKTISPFLFKAEKYIGKDGKVRQRSIRVPNPTHRSYLKGLDGRLLPIRSSHAALNTLLQSAGALISKKATVLLYEDLEGRGWRFGKDYALMAHVHDEVQLWARPEIAEDVGKACVAAFEAAGEHFNFRCPITGEYKIGDNWYDTH